MNALEERIKHLRHRSARPFPGLVAEIKGLVTQASDLTVARADLLAPFHTLAGTAGTFGFEEIAAVAWESECILASSAAPEITAGELEQLTARVVQLEEALHRQLQSVDESPDDTTWVPFEGGGVV